MCNHRTRAPPAGCHKQLRHTQVRCLSHRQHALPVVTQPPPPTSASSDDLLGPYPAGDFVISTGRSGKGSAIPQALWYFKDDVIAIPRTGRPVAGFAPGLDGEGRRRSLGGHARAREIDRLSTADLGCSTRRDSRRALERGCLSPRRRRQVVGLRARTEDCAQPVLFQHIVGCISQCPHADRPRHRRMTAGSSAVRLWPDDFRVDLAAPTRHVAATPRGIRQLVREEPQGGAQSAFAATTLWERTPARALGTTSRCSRSCSMARRATMTRPTAATSRSSPVASVDDGAMGNWLANNFYTLDSYSEKGHHRGPDTAGQLSGRSEQRAGVVPPVIPAGRDPGR